MHSHPEELRRGIAVLNVQGESSQHTGGQEQCGKRRLKRLKRFKDLPAATFRSGGKFSKMTLKRMERAGRLPALKIGRSVRYRLADIERIEAESAVR
jgi:hypothetical protein